MCEPGFVGRACGEACDFGFYGFNCAQRCNCSLDGMAGCNPINGKCFCKTDFEGDQCEVSTFVSSTQEPIEEILHNGIEDQTVQEEQKLGNGTTDGTDNLGSPSSDGNWIKALLITIGIILFLIILMLALRARENRLRKRQPQVFSIHYSADRREPTPGSSDATATDEDNKAKLRRAFSRRNHPMEFPQMLSAANLHTALNRESGDFGFRNPSFRPSTKPIPEQSTNPFADPDSNKTHPKVIFMASTASEVDDDGLVEELNHIYDEPTPRPESVYRELGHSQRHIRRPTPIGAAKNIDTSYSTVEDQK